jgi:hypothetical protein
MRQDAVFGKYAVPMEYAYSVLRTPYSRSLSGYDAILLY